MQSFLSLKNGSTLLRESSNAPQGCAEKDCNMEANRIVYSKLLQIKFIVYIVME